MAVIPESLSLGELSHLEDLGIIDTILNVAVTGVSIAKEIEAIRASREATKTQDRLAKMQISIEQQRAAQEAIVKEAEA
ncbi:MAG: hypothetical protein GTO63_00290, partial [Anaerolineae bacterium]|nr:hypothetical protein [Anaerolineae bacterium]NIN93437.1 hypothetical protein [Anaerolineae bacterium]NIQ76799.1 hypothetical protein [Anaerolineae bacterium]